jgi:UDPglucose 6-dehydrogenase
LENAAKRFPELVLEPDLDATLDRADAVLLLTEWRLYRELDPHQTARLVKERRILDGRNVLDPAKWRSAGWAYKGLGRP